MHKALNDHIVAAIEISESLKLGLLTRLLKMAYLEFCTNDEVELSEPSTSDKRSALRSVDRDRPPKVIGSWDWDIKADSITCDPEVALLFNADAKEAAQGLPISAFATAVHPDDLSRFNLAIDRTIRDGSAYSIVYRLVQADQSIKWVFAIGRGVMENGEVTRFPGTLIDVSEDEARRNRGMNFHP